MEILAGAAGGAREEWAAVVGEVTKLPVATNVRCNWSVTPRGSKGQRDTVAAAVEIVRAEHPYVARDSTLTPSWNMGGTSSNRGG